MRWTPRHSRAYGGCGGDAWLCMCRCRSVWYWEYTWLWGHRCVASKRVRVKSTTASSSLKMNEHNGGCQWQSLENVICRITRLVGLGDKSWVGVKPGKYIYLIDDSPSSIFWGPGSGRSLLCSSLVLRASLSWYSEPMAPSSIDIWANFKEQTPGRLTSYKKQCCTFNASFRSYAA